MAATLSVNPKDAVLDFFRRASSYPDRPSSVEVVETHISWVFLTDRFAYKLKKPVRFEFLDFSTLELRHRACEEEVRLNRRLAPNIYVGVLPVTQDPGGGLSLAGGGDLIDWVVQMKRLPSEKAVDAALRNRRLESKDAVAIAECLTSFYGSLLPVALSAEGFRRTLDRHIRANGAALCETLPDELARIRRIQGAQLQYLTVEADVFDRRVDDGRIVEGHGDLRPEHIYLVDPPAVIDCIEFSRELRTVDVADELSFLDMESQRLGDSGLGQLVLASYERSSGDDIPVALLAFYRTYRACVRAKISALRAAQESKTQRRSCIRLARQYLTWADHYAAEFGRSVLVVVGGLMGTGKSSLAARLADGFGAELVSTDHIRQLMLGPSDAPAQYGRGVYEPHMRNRIYEELLRQADVYLRKGRSVILDGTFLTRKWRERAHILGERHRAASAHVCCTCPKDVAIARVRQRAEAGGSESEARVDLYEAQSAEFQPPLAVEAVVKIDTTQPVARQLRLVGDQLRVRTRPQSSTGASR